jgi:hypothetical protein
MNTHTSEAPYREPNQSLRSVARTMAKGPIHPDAIRTAERDRCVSICEANFNYYLRLAEQAKADGHDGTYERFSMAASTAKTCALEIGGE